MPDFSMWGAEASPTRLVENDRLQSLAILSNASYQQAQASLVPAHRRLYEAQASSAELAVEREKRVMEALSKVSKSELIKGAEGAQMTDQDNDPLLQGVARQVKAGNLLMDMGLVEEGGKLLTQASTILSHRSTAMSARGLAFDRAIQTERHKLDLRRELLGTVLDQGSQDAAEARYRAMTGESLFGGAPYDDRRTEAMRAQATDYDKLLTARQRAEHEKLYRQSVESAITYRGIAGSVIQRRAAVAEAAENRRASAIGKVSRPKAQDITAANSYLSGKLEIEDKNEKYAAAEALAARTNRKLASNPGMEPDEARAAAFAEMMQDRDFETIRTEGIKIPIIGEVGGKTQGRFVGGGKTAEQPLFPQIAGGKINTKAMVPNRWYVMTDNRTGDTVVGKWNGSKLTDLRPYAFGETPEDIPPEEE